MIENIEQAKERLKEIVDFYKLNDTDNYDYDDRVLISMKLVLEEIERLHSIIKEATEYIKEKYIEDYSNNDNYIPLEQLNLKNCSWERSLQVLEILDKEVR